MQSITYPSGWVRNGNIFAFPHDWQVPAKTELWAYEQLLVNPNSDIYTQYICFPWASLVDYLDYQPEKAKQLLTALENRPPKMARRVISYCQHIYALKVLPYLKACGVTDLYWSHKIKGQDEVDGIRLHPYSLYPVMHYKRQKPYKNKPLKERKYLYSFVGSYQPDLYLTEVRKWIFDLPKRDDAVVIERSEWHFEQDVYRSQLLGEAEDEVRKRIREQHEREYIDVMEETVFCLCPSGSGPNSIRLWEAVKFGCVPIVFSEKLDVGSAALLKESIFRTENKMNVECLPSFLEQLMSEF